MVDRSNQSSLLVWTVLFSGLFVGLGRPARAEPPGTLAGLRPILPVVPNKDPRLSEGAGEDAQWQIAAPENPVASFIESLKGNDAALEVIVGQGRLVTLKQDLAGPNGTSVIAVGDPSVIDFEVLPNPRMIRLVGLRTGVTDLSIVLADGDSYSFEVHVVYDLPLLRAQIRQMFPGADLRLAQLREHVVVEGQARSPRQVTQIIAAIRYYLDSVQTSSSASGTDGVVPTGSEKEGANQGDQEPDSGEEGSGGGPSNEDNEGQESAGDAPGSRPNVNATIPPARIINLINVPGVHQVLLKVRIAEFDRNAAREFGADIGAITHNGTLLGTQIGGASVAALAELAGSTVGGSGVQATSANSSVYGIFPTGHFDVILKFLRTNGLGRVLAEPNLVTLSGHRASFLAGGEIPIPVPSGQIGTTTIQFKQFGVQLDFLPFVLDDERIRLSVTPEVSRLDFSQGTTIVAGASPVPAILTRRTNTTVELHEGQTLAIAGLKLLNNQGTTSRIPGLGDLPYIGQLFSNNRHSSDENELLVIITPYLVEPLNDHEQHIPLPGEHVMEPNDEEFYFMGRIEGRTGRPFRSTTEYEHFDHMPFERPPAGFHGPVGFSAP